jgi:hypothetical protein
VAERLSVSAVWQSGEEQPFLAELSSRLEETSRAPAIARHFVGAYCQAYRRTRSRSGSRQETLPRPPTFGQKIHPEILDGFEWLPRTELLLRCDEASSCPKSVLRPWAMGRWRQQNSKLGYTVHRKHQFLQLRLCGASRNPRCFPATFFSPIEASSCTLRPIRYRSPAV